MLVATVTPLKSRNELTQWDNRPFCGAWPDPQYKKPTGVTKPLKKKTRRNRTAYTTEQLRALEKSFTQSRYIDSETRRELARSLKIGEKCIKIWFQNRRMKEKRDSSESSSDTSSETFPVDSGETGETTPITLNYNLQNQMYQQEKEVPLNNAPQATEYQPNYSPEAHNNIQNPMYFYNNVYPTEYYPNCGQEYYANDVNYYQNANYGNANNGYWCANNYFCYN